SPPVALLRPAREGHGRTETLSFVLAQKRGTQEVIYNSLMRAAPRPMSVVPYPRFALTRNRVELGGAAFKGFFIAAMDPVTQKRIGTFLKVKGTHPVSCSAVTHNDAHPKSHVSLLWLPPQNVPEGDVVFMSKRAGAGIAPRIPSTPAREALALHVPSCGALRQATDPILVFGWGHRSTERTLVGRSPPLNTSLVFVEYRRKQR
ncbi:hypothetical protein HPB47_023090, partial [Ixodes persulcatus]